MSESQSSAPLLQNVDSPLPRESSDIQKYPYGTIRPASDSDSASDRENAEIPSISKPISHLSKSWDLPRSDVYRLCATFLSFIAAGANDAAYGALLPYLEKYYDISYITVSFLFLSPFIGSLTAASLNDFLHMKVGQRGVAIICGTCRLISYLTISQHPPYAVLVFVYILIGFAGGLANGAWNAWVGNLERANELLGFLHAFYGMGGIISPLIATTMITKLHLPWYMFYYVMLALSICDLITSSIAFWRFGPEAYREATQAEDGNETQTGMKTALLSFPHARVTWLCAFFLLSYGGVEVSLGGWIVKFMMHVRKADPFSAGMSSVGFWLGLTVGRAVLGFVTSLMGVKLAVAFYIPAAIVSELLFWLVPNFYVSAIAVALQGFFLGPMFPAVIVAMTKLLPASLHINAIAFVSSFSGTGSALLPFGVGAIAQTQGVQVLQPIILVCLTMLLFFWMGLPAVGEKRR